MTSTHASLRAYRETATRTATPGALVLMLFDGALRFLEMATQGFAETNFIRRQEKINNNVLKAHAILTELRGTLNMDAGGEFAQRMFALYGFMQEQLLLGNQKKAPEPLAIVQGLLGEIRDAWAEMLATTTGTPIATQA
jgi:flagellar protein FliS